MTRKAKKLVLSKLFRRDEVPERRSDPRPQSSSPTSGLSGRERGMSPPKSRQQEISWVDYEELIKARQDEKYSTSPETRSRSHSVTRSPSRSRQRSPSETRPNEESEDEDVDDPSGKHHVRFSASLAVRPSEALPFPFLRKSSQTTVVGERHRSSLGSELRDGEKCFEGEIHFEAGRSIVATPRVPGDEKWRNDTKEPPSITQKLDLEGLAMQVPKYLADMRGESRRSSLRALSTVGPLISSNRRSAFVRSVMAATNIEGTRDNRTSNSKYITIAPKARLSTVIVPVNAKQWLLQSMRLRDPELRDLFDQMESVPQFAGDHVREVRAEWEALEARQLKVPPEADTLVMDKTLLDRVKRILAHFIELDDSKSPEQELLEVENRVGKLEDIMEGTAIAGTENETDKEGPRGTPIRERKQSHSQSPSMMFQGFERDREGSLSAVFGLGASSCPLCGQAQPRSIGKDGQPLPPTSELRCGPLLDELANPRHSLQPAKRENILLLGEWLRHACRQNQCENAAGQFADVDSAFILHSIAFLEVVRQVRLQCEERGDMLLHVWRQLLRIFSQVMIRAEPKLLAMEKDCAQLKETIHLDKLKIAQISQDLAATTQTIETTESQLREKEIQWSQLKRCRLCAGDEMNPSSHERMHHKGSMGPSKWAAGAGAGAGGEGEEEEDGSFGTSSTERSQKGGSGGHDHQKDHKGKGGKGQDRDMVTGGPGGEPGTADGSMQLSGNQGNAGPGDPNQADGESETVQVDESSMDAYEPGKISEGILHMDGLHADVGVQKNPDTEGRSLFFDVLKRPVSAPGRFMTAIIEEFAMASGVVHRDLEEGEQEVVKKEPEVTGLTAADIAMLDATDYRREEEEEWRKSSMGKVKKSALKMLAVDTVEILEQLPELMEGEKADQLQGLIGRFRWLRRGSLDDNDGDNDGPDGDGPRGSKKKRGWGKVKRRIEESKKRRDMFFSIAQELMDRQKKPAKVTKSKDLPNVPLGFAKMMKVNPPPKVIKNFNEHQLMKLVEDIYAKKIEADAIDDAQENDRQSACEFVYDFMLNVYGLKGLAESALHGVFKKIKQMMISKGIEKTHKLRLFQRFCNFDPLRGYAELDLYLYLKCLAKAQSRVGIFFPSEGDDGMSFINTGQLDFLLEEPALLAQFRGNKDIAADFLEQFAAANATVEKVTPEVQKIVKSPMVKKLDFDFMMEAIIEVSPHKEVKKPPKAKVAAKSTSVMSKEDSVALENLFVAGDANQDGVLTFTEFREIISCADSSVSETNALRIFRETLLLMPDGGDNISPSAFATVAHSHDIRATPAVIFDLLKKTWLQIQDDINEEKLTDKAKKKECDEMRAMIREMLKERKGSDVGHAVQTFQSFVLKFCGKDEPEGAEVSPAEPEPEES